MRYKFLFFAAVILFVTSCKTGSNFTSRRYMAGHYKSNRTTLKKPDALAAKRHDNSLRKETHEKAYEVKEAPVLIAAKTDKKTEFVKKKHKALSFTNGIAKAKENKIIKNAFAGVKSIFSKNTKPLKSGTGDGGISQKSIIGFACGVGGIAIDIIVFLVAVASLNYAVLLGMIVGLALGILGIIFGTQGIKDYRSSRNTPTLVFGIVGAATGLAAIILAIYLGIYGAVMIAVYSI